MKLLVGFALLRLFGALRHVVGLALTAHGIFPNVKALVLLFHLHMPLGYTLVHDLMDSL